MQTIEPAPPPPPPPVLTAQSLSHWTAGKSLGLLLLGFVFFVGICLFHWVSIVCVCVCAVVHRIALSYNILFISLALLEMSVLPFLI